MKQIGKFILLNREEFKSWLDLQRFKRKIKLIQNHHTYIPNYSHFSGSNHFEKVAGMEKSHINRGFGEIAQNITTFNDGTICVCRNFDVMPCGIKGANQFGVCIEHLGNFDIGGDKMSEEHRNTIIFVNAILCVKFYFKPDINSIVYHHWYDLSKGTRTNGTGNTKSCPGTNFFGGNTTESAEKNFIPLIINCYNSIVEEKPTVDSKINLPKGKVIVDANDVLYVRVKPDWKSLSVKTLKIGDIVEIYDKKDGWYKINKDEQWVSSKFIQKL